MKKRNCWLIYLFFSITLFAQTEEDETIYYEEDDVYYEEYEEEDEELAVPIEEVAPDYDDEYYDEDYEDYEEDYYFNSSLDYEDFTPEKSQYSTGFRDAYTNNPDFDYEERLPPPKQTQSNPSSQTYTPPSSSSSGNFDFSFMEFIFYLVIIVLIIIIAYYIFQFFDKKTVTSYRVTNTQKDTLVAVEDNPEDIHEDNYTVLAEKAENEGNTRLAIRYLFLYVLQQLDKKNLLSWHKKKTNTDYYTELQNDSLKPQFLTLSNIYDYVWFGEYPVEEYQYKDIKSAMLSISKIPVKK